MGTRDMAARVNQHHERRPDSQRRNHARPAPDHRAADGQNEEESPDEFRDVLVHALKCYAKAAGRSKPHLSLLRRSLTTPDAPMFTPVERQPILARCCEYKM